MFLIFKYIYHINQIKINKKHVYHTKVLYCIKPMSIQDESGSIPEESINF
jgi:hypothetical protein